MHTIMTLVLTAVLAAGCGTSTTVARGSKAAVTKEQQVQEERFIQAHLNRARRVSRLSFPILRNNVLLCGKAIKMDIGATWLTSHDLGAAMARPLAPHRKTLMDRFWIRDHPMLVDVVPGGPAAAAGLRKWDMIVAVNGKEIPKGRAFWGGSKSTNTLEAAIRGGNFTVTYMRRGVQYTARVTPKVICRHNIYLVSGDAINAFTDGKDIYLMTGMLRFAQSDLDLQTIIAHELAHNTAGHIRKRMGNTILGAIIDSAFDGYAGIDTGGDFAEAGALAFSQDFEREADYIGMYMLERAGVETSEAGNFWRRMSLENPAAISFAHTHPTTAERAVNLRATTWEIQAKRRQRLPLLPNPK